MPEPVLWEREPHTRAKHLVLRSYIDAWFPVLAHAELDARRRDLKIGKPRLLMVDGFAGPGRYVGDEAGSPLIMLDALRSHDAFDRFQDVDFIFLFIEDDARRVEHLADEVTGLGQLPPNVHVHVEHGAFETVFGLVIDDISPGRVLVPTFAFIDPFGYSHSPMSLTGRLLGFPRAEALIFLPLSLDEAKELLRRAYRYESRDSMASNPSISLRTKRIPWRKRGAPAPWVSARSCWGDHRNR